MGESEQYLVGRKEWHDRYFDLVVAKRNWQVVSGVFAVVSVVMSAGLVTLSLKSKVVPYVVQVDKAGYAVAVERLVETVPEDLHLVRYQLGRFVVNARTVSSDPVALKAMLDGAYSYARGAAAEYMNEYYRVKDPFERGRGGSVEVELVSLLPVSERSWQLRWREVERNLAGKVVKRENFEGRVEVKLELPKSGEELMKNPLGMFVTELSWVRGL